MGLAVQTLRALLFGITQRTPVEVVFVWENENSVRTSAKAAVVVNSSQQCNAVMLPNVLLLNILANFPFSAFKNKANVVGLSLSSPYPAVLCVTLVLFF